ncbi:hypothetical protein ACQ33O_12835 [Ferruginibacter sp. SUN002]|uniref:hypothetical protein n=1 Tax=Ferruginibacter sp. SUN002 TaxID=2937789 RepID=UPI003D366D77
MILYIFLGCLSLMLFAYMRNRQANRNDERRERLQQKQDELIEMLQNKKDSTVNNTNDEN